MKLFLTTLLLTFCIAVNAQWKGKKSAVSLTYDDALNVHLDNAIPLLDSLQLKATFYLSCYANGFRNRIADWKKAAQTGHELGNHTLFHPCTGGPGREWVNPDYDLSRYTISRFRDELRMTNSLLESLDGKKTRSFAYPCGDTTIGSVAYIDRKDFPSARGVYPGISLINEIDLYHVTCFSVVGQSGEQLIAAVKEAIQKGGLLVFLFHGVGGEHSLNVSLEAHRQLLQFLKQNEKDIWIAPFIEITDYVKQYNSK